MTRLETLIDLVQCFYNHLFVSGRRESFVCVMDVVHLLRLVRDLVDQGRSTSAVLVWDQLNRGTLKRALAVPKNLSTAERSQLQSKKQDALRLYDSICASRPSPTA